MKADFSEINITPSIGCYLAGYFTPRKSNGVVGELEARVAVFSDDDNEIAIVSLI